jgi:hypothetical protein
MVSFFSLKRTPGFPGIKNQLLGAYEEFPVPGKAPHNVQRPEIVGIENSGWNMR